MRGHRDVRHQDGGRHTRPTVLAHVSSHGVAASPEQVWAAIDDVRRFPSWWSWLRDFEADRRHLEPGLVMRARVSPPVPYPMRVTVHVEEVARLARVEALVSGDLEGPASLRLSDAGGGCLLTVAWRVEMHRPVMRAVARMARPVLARGHDQVVERTVRGFREQVEDPRAR